ncbi:MAG: hypothetical protein H6934_08405 [Burkholderiaceae bacterium]|nr:hypothetical protein [Burkholderiaceae bacterium]
MGTFGTEAQAIAAHNRAILQPGTCPGCRAPARAHTRPPTYPIDGKWIWTVECPRGKRWSGWVWMGKPGSPTPATWSKHSGGGTMRSLSVDGPSVVMVRGLSRSQGGDQTWYGTIRNRNLITGTLGTPYQDCRFTLVRNPPQKPRPKPVDSRIERPPEPPKPIKPRQPVRPPANPPRCDRGSGSTPSYDGLICR